jgi:glutamyl-tRNA reductase
VSRLAHMHREASQEEGKAMKVVILGAGALGSLTGAHLARAGEEILFIARNKRARSRAGHMHVRHTVAPGFVVLKEERAYYAMRSD